MLYLAQSSINALKLNQSLIQFQFDYQTQIINL